MLYIKNIIKKSNNKKCLKDKRITKEVVVVNVRKQKKQNNEQNTHTHEGL